MTSRTKPTPARASAARAMPAAPAISTAAAPTARERSAGAATAPVVNPGALGPTSVRSGLIAARPPRLLRRTARSALPRRGPYSRASRPSRDVCASFREGPLGRGRALLELDRLLGLHELED